MIHQKDGGQVGQTISHYAPKAHPPLADKILEKLGEVPNFPASTSQRVVGSLSIPLFLSGSGRSLV